LALENTQVRQAVATYVEALRPVVQGKADVIGFACIINGKIKSVDVCASNALFLKLWPKMIDAAATEALADMEKGRKYEVVSADRVKEFMNASQQGKEVNLDVNGRVALAQKEGQGVVEFDTRDRAVGRGTTRAAGRGGTIGGAAGGMGTGGSVRRSWVGR
jgi:hypothetical protein